MQNPEFKTSPFFVCGVARSGTSFMHHILNEHPSIKIAYESKLFDEGYEVYKHNKKIKSHGDFAAFSKKLAEIEKQESQNNWMVNILNQNSEELYLQYTKEPSYEKLVEKIFNFPDSAHCWGNKMLRLARCSELLSRWPNAKIIVLLRNPKAVFLSQKKYFGFRIKSSAIYWNRHSKLTRELAEDSSNYLIVKYEELVMKPVNTLGKILQFLGINEKKSAENLLSKRPVKTTRVDAYKTELNAEEEEMIAGLCFDEMRYWGYDPAPAGFQRNINTLDTAKEMILEYLPRLPLNPRVWRRKKILQRFFKILLHKN